MIKSNYILYAVRWYQKLKKEEGIFGCKNRGLQLNQAKILQIYPIV